MIDTQTFDMRNVVLLNEPSAEHRVAPKFTSRLSGIGPIAKDGMGDRWY